MCLFRAVHFYTKRDEQCPKRSAIYFRHVSSRFGAERAATSLVRVYVYKLVYITHTHTHIVRVAATQRG